jgi:SWI/SNF-related matrix-associated actin-dependent regulator of chromatin subfamily A-like protein 1
MTTENMVQKIQTSDGYAIGALLEIFKNQEIDERASNCTAHKNGKGFTAIDAGILTSISKFYLEKGFISPKQLQIVRSKILKYQTQLSFSNVQEMPIKPYEKKESSNPSMKTEINESGMIEISFGYDPELIAKIKTLTGRRWNAPAKKWICPITDDNIDKLQSFGFPKIEGTVKEKQTSPFTMPSLKMKPYTYQEEGIEFIHKNNGRGLIGDEMGLGKTVQFLGFLECSNANKTVIVCPATLKLNWVNEIKKWLPDDKYNVYLLQGTNALVPATSTKFLKISCRSEKEIIIINYDILTNWVKNLINYKPDLLCFDESHNLKNNSAQKTKAGMLLGKHVKRVVCLSGTPIINRPIEFFNTIKLLNPMLFPSKMMFAKRYCNAKHNGFGWDFNGSSNTEELHKMLSKTIMIRRKKSEVLTELPPKRRIVIPLEISNRSEYETAKENFLDWLQNKEGDEAVWRASQAETLVKIEKLKQLAVNGKWSQVKQWVQNFLEEKENLVIFCTHTETIKLLAEFLKKEKISFGIIDGSTSIESRQKSVDNFQAKKIRVILGNLKAAGVGITLTAASDTCFIELGWTPGDHDQAEDRVHRIGQKESVTAHYLIAEGTVEEEMSELLDYKRGTLNKVLDGQNVSDDSLLVELLKRFKEK